MIFEIMTILCHFLCSYCPCFAAKVYCSSLCSCQGCSNNHAHEELVSCTRKRTESHNPLAFAPTVTHTYGTVLEFGVRTKKNRSYQLHFYFFHYCSWHPAHYRMILTKLLLLLDIKEDAIAGSLLVLKNTASAFRYHLTCQFGVLNLI